jgi:hypothetical protein
MVWTAKRRMAALMVACAATLVSVTPAAAASPTVDVFTVHREASIADCADFTIDASWDITHRLTVFADESGVPVRDIERVDYTGRFSNSETGASVPDSGTRIFFDTLAPDGSFLTTYMVEVRKSAYVHVAGRTDFQTGAFHGTSGFDDAGIAALCAALDR